MCLLLSFACCECDVITTPSLLAADAGCCLRLHHVYSSPGLYHVQLRYTDSVSPLVMSVVVVVEELPRDVRLVGPSLVSFVR